MGRDDVRGVLFDVDGTLVDSTYLHAVAWWQAFTFGGHEVTVADCHRAVGMGADTLVPHLIGELSEDETSELAQAHDALYSTWWPSLSVLPGARELVRRCHEAGLTTVLASSAGAREVEVVRDLLGLDEFLDVITSSDDGEQSKPAPDLVQVALERAGLAAEQAVMIGDSVWDVKAAGRAGVRCLGLECGGTSAAELREAGAQDVFTHPQDLLEHWSVLAG